jgi:acetyltransferase-like isoleucine patch superfamily enzyme
VRISGQVKFITRDAGTWAFSRESKNKEIVKFGRIIIGDDTFVGTCSIILPGVTIGKNCVIGAGSVVTHDIPDRMVVAGIPARPICSLDEYKNKCKKKMPENFDYKQYVVNKCEYLKTIY